MTPQDTDRLARIRAGMAGRTRHEGGPEPDDEFLMRLLECAWAALDTLIANAETAEALPCWQPIETAPRDGTDFLAALPWQGHHHQMVGCFAPSGRFVSWPARIEYHPTHWRALGPPPIDGRKQAGVPR